MIIGDKVVDVSKVLASDRSTLLLAAGKDISHWFDISENGVANLKTLADSTTGLPNPCTPDGPFPGVWPVAPRTDFDCSAAKSWWQNEDLVVGKVAQNPFLLRIVNTLTGRESVLECDEGETIAAIQARYADLFNSNQSAYDWKGITKQGYVSLNSALSIAASLPDSPSVSEMKTLKINGELTTLAIVFRDRVSSEHVNI